MRRRTHSDDGTHGLLEAIKGQLAHAFFASELSLVHLLSKGLLVVVELTTAGAAQVATLRHRFGELKARLRRKRAAVVGWPLRFRERAMTNGAMQAVVDVVLAVR
jgi:hypothetical protein